MSMKAIGAGASVLAAGSLLVYYGEPWMERAIATPPDESYWGVLLYSLAWGSGGHAAEKAVQAAIVVLAWTFGLAGYVSARVAGTSEWRYALLWSGVIGALVLLTSPGTLRYPVRPKTREALALLYVVGPWVGAWSASRRNRAHQADESEARAEAASDVIDIVTEAIHKK